MRQELPVTALLGKVHAGTASEQEIQDLVGHYQAQSLRLAIAKIAPYLGARIEAESVVNDALRSAISAAGKSSRPAFAGRDEFWRFLNMIVVRKVASLVEHEKAQRRSLELTVALPGDDALPTSTSAVNLGGAELEVRELAEQLAVECLRESTVERQLINVLGHLAGYSAASIRTVLQQSNLQTVALSTISLCLQTSRQRLQKSLLGVADD